VVVQSSACCFESVITFARSYVLISGSPISSDPFPPQINLGLLIIASCRGRESFLPQIPRSYLRIKYYLFPNSSTSLIWTCWCIINQACHPGIWILNCNASPMLLPSSPESSCMQHKNAAQHILQWKHNEFGCWNIQIFMMWKSYCADDVVAGTGGWQSGCWSSTWPPSLGWRTNQRYSLPIHPLPRSIAYYSRLLLLLACLCGWFGFHASLFLPTFFFRWVLFFLCYIPLLLFFPFFLLHTSSCMLPCFPNIGDERNSRARKGNRCTIQMWDYPHIHLGLYIYGALTLPAFTYIIYMYMLTSACGLFI